MRTRDKIRLGALAGGFGLVAALATSAAAAGAQFSIDHTQTLVNKNVGLERWAISYRLVDGRVTGNVFVADQDAPVFLDCKQLRVSTEGIGTFECFSAGPCAEEPCSPREWQFLATTDLAVSFFFPPGPEPGPDCSNWGVSLSSSEATSTSCRLTMTVDNRRCDVPQTEFDRTIVNCSGQQVDLSSQFRGASVGAREIVEFPIVDLPRACRQADAVVELTLSGFTRASNEVDCGNPCLPNGSACEVSGQCCSHECDRLLGAASGTCRAQSCLPTDALCSTSAQCCGRACAPILAAPAGTYRCDEQSDECTGLSQRCDSIHSCCAGAVCRNTGLAEFCVAASCKAYGQTCTSNDDCCQGNCESVAGRNVCIRTNCQNVGQYCLTNSDCCAGGACEGTGAGTNGGAFCVAVPD